MLPARNTKEEKNKSQILQVLPKMHAVVWAVVSLEPLWYSFHLSFPSHRGRDLVLNASFVVTLILATSLGWKMVTFPRETCSV